MAAEVDPHHAPAGGVEAGQLGVPHGHVGGKRVKAEEGAAIVGSREFTVDVDAVCLDTHDAF
jgi:hypothetical protein